MEQLNAEWIEYMDSYRVYEPEEPERTLLYEERLSVIVEAAKINGYKRLVIDLT